MMKPTVGPILKTLVFTVLVPGTVAVLVPRRIAGSWPHAAGGLLGILGSVLMVAGGAIYLACAWEFAYHGLGTPAPIDAPRQLISCGLNRFVRNPMYIGVLTVVLGQAALFRSLQLVIYAACIWIACHLFVVIYEEPTLQRQFGSAYEEYRKAVPRWIPRFPTPSR